MSEIFPRYDLTFEVLYMAWTESDRHWRFQAEDMRYPHCVFRGVHPVIKHVNLHFNPTLLVHLRRHPADIVIVGGFSSPTHMLAPFACRGRTFKLLWSESNLDSSRLNKGVTLAVKRALVGQYAGFLVPGERATEYLEFLDPSVTSKPIIKLPNLIDKSLFAVKTKELRKDRQQIRQSLGVGGSQQLWVCPARLEEFKGLQLFLPLLKGIENIQLFVAGDGSLRAYLQREIDTNGLPVRLIGQQKQEEMLRLYAAADLFVLPSLRDPSPLSPIEASAASLPLLLSRRVGNLKDVLQPGKNGWVYDPDEPERFRPELKKIARMNTKKLKDMGEKSFELYSQVFDSEVCIGNLAEGLLSAYEAFLKTAGN